MQESGFQDKVVQHCSFLNKIIRKMMMMMMTTCGNDNGDDDNYHLLSITPLRALQTFSH